MGSQDRSLMHCGVKAQPKSPFALTLRFGAKGISQPTK